MPFHEKIKFLPNFANKYKSCLKKLSGLKFQSIKYFETSVVISIKIKLIEIKKKKLNFFLIFFVKLFITFFKVEINAM